MFALRKSFFLLLFIGFIIQLPAQKVRIDLDEFKTRAPGFDTIAPAVKEAEKIMRKRKNPDYQKALQLYMKAYKYNPENAELNYQIANCYLNGKEKRSALPYILKAAKMKPEMTPMLDWHIGQAYHYNEEYEKAYDYYRSFRAYISKKGGNTVKVKQRMKQCRNGIEMKNKPINIEINNLSALNSKFDDYAPLVTADKSSIIFTSRRAGSTGGLRASDQKYYEDIYRSDFVNGKWTEPVNVGKPMNTKYHDATVGISPDGQELFLYHNGNIFYTRSEGKSWQVPKAMPAEINSTEVENSAAFSYNGKEIYFVRGKDPDPDKSNSDIYVSYHKNGTWTDAEPVSSRINTPFDEDGVFMHPDGKTLYFSSKGHNSIGGFDIFKSTKDERGRWQDPVNLGYPLNTADDDLFFVLSADGKTAFYSSLKPGGKGGLDIYEIDFEPQKDTAQTDTTSSPKVFLTLVKGIITDGKTRDKLEADIEIVDNESSEIVMTVKSNSSSGKYLVSLPSGKNYGMEVKKKGYLFHSENFKIEEKDEYQEFVKNIRLYPIEKDVKVVLRNIFFDTNKSKLRPESYTELNKLKNLLEKNPKMNIEISGHTDNQGSYAHNKALSKARAQAVVDYLIKNGIDKNRLKSRGASWDEPIDTNDTPKGRQKNRRVEFKVLE